MAAINFISPTHTILAQEMLQSSSKKLAIVDYGCGEGELLQYIPKKKIGLYQGFEVNKNGVVLAQEKWKKVPNVHFSVIDRKKLPAIGKRNSQDIFVLVGVVQYLPARDFEHVLNEAKRTLKPGGKILISCTTDHRVYTWLNLYRLFVPHFTVNRSTLHSKLTKKGFAITKEYERGIILNPMFSNVIVFFFDALDRVMFKTAGSLGPIGRKMRKILAPLLAKEFTLQIDYGYTLFIVATK